MKTIDKIINLRKEHLRKNMKPPYTIRLSLEDHHNIIRELQKLHPYPFHQTPYNPTNHTICGMTIIHDNTTRIIEIKE